MKTILIVFHSLTGGTRQMADAAERGAKAQTDVQVRLLQAREAGPDDVLNADGYIFATPENLAAMAGMMKCDRLAAAGHRPPDHCLYARTDATGDFRAKVDLSQRAPPVRGAWFCLIRRSDDGDFLMVPLQTDPADKFGPDGSGRSIFDLSAGRAGRRR